MKPGGDDLDAQWRIEVDASVNGIGVPCFTSHVVNSKKGKGREERKTRNETYTAPYSSCPNSIRSSHPSPSQIRDPLL